MNPLKQIGRRKLTKSKMSFIHSQPRTCNKLIMEKKNSSSCIAEIRAKCVSNYLWRSCCSSIRLASCSSLPMRIRSCIQNSAGLIAQFTEITYEEKQLRSERKLKYMLVKIFIFRISKTKQRSTHLLTTFSNHIRHSQAYVPSLVLFPSASPRPLSSFWLSICK